MMNDSYERQEPSYRVMFLTTTGAVVNSRPLSAKNDEHAIKIAKAFTDGYAVELWDGLRFIEHFPPLKS